MTQDLYGFVREFGIRADIPAMDIVHVGRQSAHRPGN
jgi:hypothetical protein